MFLRSLILCLLPMQVHATDPLTWTELQLLYHSDLAIDAQLVRQDGAHVWVRVNEVLRDTGFGIRAGDAIRVDKAAAYDCGYPLNLVDARRLRLYLQKEVGKGEWALLKRMAGSAVHFIRDRAYMNMPATVELPIAEFDRCMIEFQTCYVMVGESDDFIARCPQARIDSLAKHNAIITQFEKQGRTVTAAHLFAEPEMPAVDPPPPAPIRECVWLEQPPRILADQGDDPSSMLSVVDPTPDALGQRTVVRVLIDVDGRIRDGIILRASNPQRDSVALRAIAAMPLMEPGRNKGVPTACYEVFPIRFVVPKE